MSEEPVVATSLKRPLYLRTWFLAAAAICAILVPVLGAGALASVFPVRLEGEGMSPTLNDGDLLLIRRAFGKIERGDIVLFRFPKDTTKSFLKRVIALPGDTVRIDYAGKLHINGSVKVEPYLSTDRNTMARILPEKTLAADEYFVMGDNRDASNDSRSWGPLQRGLIYGKFLVRYWASQ